MRRLLPVLAILVAVAAAAPASAATTLTCKSADLRYPFMPGGPKTFGVFKLKIAGGGCTTAHSVAKAWMKAFEADIEKGKVRVRRTVNGFVFTNLRATAAQTYNMRGRKAAVTIRFDYVVPNG